MKKRIVLSLIIMLVLFATIGCGKGVKGEDGKTTFACVKRGIKDTSNTSGTGWEEDITYTAKVDDDGKLTYYSSLYHYTYNSQEDCNYWCDIKVKWNDEINENGYSGGHRETKCNCDKKELDEKYIYDDIPNLASILRSDIRELKSDNTFDLDNWLSKREKNGYNCG